MTGIVWVLLILAAGFYLGRTYERYQHRAPARCATGERE